MKAVYEQRGGSPLWTGSDGRVQRKEAILLLLDQAAEHGLDPQDYGRDSLALMINQVQKLKGNIESRVTLIAEADITITSALLMLGRDVALGRSLPSALDARWKARRAAPDFTGTLAQLADGPLDNWLDRLRPQHAEYGRLQQALNALIGQQAKGGWQPVPAVHFVPGRSHQAVPTLRHRLAASGHLIGTDATNDSPLYDAAVTAAVKAFQEHYTLKASGTADAATIAAMNVPIGQRVRQVAMNLARWRWMPDDFGDRYLYVNIPSYHVVAREHGNEVMDIRVVVGKPGHETPVFSGEMATVVFSPYWNIPDTIVEGETAPALARDPKYLERNNIEVLRATRNGPEPVQMKEVNWDDAESLKALMFRQKPGPTNALGHVKFLFPNPFDVYLHDTPADELFGRTGRAFSHGCVRVEEPETLSAYVLRDDPSWDMPRIVDAMNAGVEKAVKMKSPIPVHIVYFTATVDSAGGIHFLNDVYGYDAKQNLEAGRAAPPKPLKS